MTTPTQLPIPSSNLLDSRFNFEKLDQIVNSDSNYYTDRFGKQRLTVKGLENLANQISIDLENDLSQADGYRLAGKVLSYDELKTITPKVPGQRILVNGYYEGTSLGGGVFEAVSGTGVEDGGYTCVVNSDWYWQRQPDNINEINLVDFGLQAGGTLDASLTSAINYQQKTGLAKIVRVPTLGHTGYYLTGGLKFAILYYNLELIGPGELSGNGSVNAANTKGCVIQHTGANTGISFEYESFGNRSIWANTHVRNFHVRGTSTGKAFVNFSDSWKNKLSDCDIRGYTTGAGYTVTNKVAWTENFIATDVMTRVCLSGCWCYQDPVDVNNVTDSFFGLVMTRCYHSFEVGGNGNAALKIGDGVNKATAYNARVQLGGWASSGGDNNLILAADGGIYRGTADMNPDGFGISPDNAPMTSATTPIVLYKKSVATLGGYIEIVDSTLLYSTYYDISTHIAAGGTVNIYPFKGIYSFGGSASSLATYRLDEPGTSIVKAIGTKVKLSGTIVAGTDLVLRLQRFPPSSIFRVTLRVDGWVPSSYIVKTYNVTGYCTVVRDDRVPSVSTTTNTTISGSTATSTSTSTAANIAQASMYLRTLGNVGDNVGSSSYYMGCEVFFTGSVLSANKVMAVDIEWVA